MKCCEGYKHLQSSLSKNFSKIIKIKKMVKPALIACVRKRLVRPWKCGLGPRICRIAIFERRA